eukprot:12405881-Karenia_brevis.AAC.1
MSLVYTVQYARGIYNSNACHVHHFPEVCPRDMFQARGIIRDLMVLVRDSYKINGSPQVH